MSFIWSIRTVSRASAVWEIFPREPHNRLPVTDRPSDLIWHPKSSGLTNNFQWQFGQRQKFRNILSFIISTVNHLQYMTSAFYESYLAFLSFDSKSPWICSLIFRNPSVLRIWQLYIFTYNHKTRRLSGSVSSETERFTVFIWQCKIESTWRGLRHVSSPFMRLYFCTVMTTRFIEFPDQYQ